MSGGTAALNSSMGRWNAFRSPLLPRNGMEANCSILPWRGFKAKREADSSDVFASHPRAGGGGARRGLRCFRAAMVDGLGSVRTGSIEDNGPDVFRLSLRASR